MLRFLLMAGLLLSGTCAAHAHFEHVETVGLWGVICSEKEKTCAVTLSSNRDQGIEMDIYFLEVPQAAKKGIAPYGIAFVANGTVDPSKGLYIELDGVDPLHYKFAHCDRDVCAVRVGLTKARYKAIFKSTTLDFVVHSAKNGRAFVREFPAKTLKYAIDAAKRQQRTRWGQ